MCGYLRPFGVAKLRKAFFIGFLQQKAYFVSLDRINIRLYYAGFMSGILDKKDAIGCLTRKIKVIVTV